MSLSESISRTTTPGTVFSLKSNSISADALQILAFKLSQEERTSVLETRADAIDAYFSVRQMPLVGLGRKMVEEAEKNDLDWRLLPAIAVRESTGGKDPCDNFKHNFFGWGSCKIGFDSAEKAIETVARNLGGNNPNTARHYGGEKTLKQILRAYNPPSVIPRYAEQVISIMNAIGDKDLGEEIKATS